MISDVTIFNESIPFCKSVVHLLPIVFGWVKWLVYDMFNVLWILPLDSLQVLYNYIPLKTDAFNIQLGVFYKLYKYCVCGIFCAPSQNMLVNFSEDHFIMQEPGAVQLLKIFPQLGSVNFIYVLLQRLRSQHFNSLNKSRKCVLRCWPVIS